MACKPPARRIRRRPPTHLYQPAPNSWIPDDTPSHPASFCPNTPSINPSHVFPICLPSSHLPSPLVPFLARSYYHTSSPLFMASYTLGSLPPHDRPERTRPARFGTFYLPLSLTSPSTMATTHLLPGQPWVHQFTFGAIHGGGRTYVASPPFVSSPFDCPSFFHLRASGRALPVSFCLQKSFTIALIKC